MKILLVNNFYYNRGGDCTYFFSLKTLLEKKGHKIIVFSMHHPQNFDSEYSKYFVSYINYADELKNKNPLSGLKVLKRSIYSIEAKKKIEGLIKEEKPDIVHLNNIRNHITPSIFYPIKRHGIPIVWTLHDYILICPNTSFLSKGRVCERCKKRKYYWPLLVRCKKDSFLASTMAAIEHTIQRITKVYDLVDIFITPSEFLRKKFIEYGFKEEKMTCQPYFIDIDSSRERETVDDYYLYVGRISEEKGVKTLIDAAIKANVHTGSHSDRPKISKLKIAGDGPVMEKMVSYARSKDKKKIIEFVGHKSRDEVIKLIKKCSFVVLPSEWYENFSYAILEAFALGKPVIASKIGGIPELVKDNETGLLFESGNADDLSSEIEYLINNPDIAMKMGENARKYVEQELNAEKHYRKLMEIYKQVAS